MVWNCFDFCFGRNNDAEPTLLTNSNSTETQQQEAHLEAQALLTKIQNVVQEADYTLGLELSKKGQSQFPQYPVFILSEAGTLRALKEHEGAKDAYQRYLDSGPTIPDLLRVIKCLAPLDTIWDLDQNTRNQYAWIASKYAERVIELNPNDVEARHHILPSYVRRELYEEALNIANNLVVAREKSPDSAITMERILYERGATLFWQRRYDDAKQDFLSVQKLCKEGDSLLEKVEHKLKLISNIKGKPHDNASTQEVDSDSSSDPDDDDMPEESRGLHLLSDEGVEGAQPQTEHDAQIAAMLALQEHKNLQQCTRF